MKRSNLYLGLISLFAVCAVIVWLNTEPAGAAFNAVQPASGHIVGWGLVDISDSNNTEARKRGGVVISAKNVAPKGTVLVEFDAQFLQEVADNRVQFIPLITRASTATASHSDRMFVTQADKEGVFVTAQKSNGDPAERGTFYIAIVADR